MKWLSVAVLAVVGVLALVVAIIYLTVPIHSLPSFIPGQIAHHRGIYHKRGAVAGIIGVVLLAAAGGLALYFRRSEASTSVGAAGGLQTPSQAPPRSPGEVSQ